MKAREITVQQIIQAQQEGAQFEQADGAIVHLIETDPGRYFYVVYNQVTNTIVTVLDYRLTWEAVEHFRGLYGWVAK